MITMCSDCLGKNSKSGEFFVVELIKRFFFCSTLNFERLAIAVFAYIKT